MVQRESNSTTDSCLYKILCWLVRPFLFAVSLALARSPFHSCFLSILHTVFHLRTRSIITVHISSMLWHCHSHRLAGSALCCCCCLPARICCFCGWCYCCCFCCCWRWWWSLLLLLLSSSSLSPSPSTFDGHHYDDDDDIFFFVLAAAIYIRVCVRESVFRSVVFLASLLLFSLFFVSFCFSCSTSISFYIRRFRSFIPFCWVNVKGGRRMGGDGRWQRFAGGGENN